MQCGRVEGKHLLYIYSKEQSYFWFVLRMKFLLISFFFILVSFCVNIFSLSSQFVAPFSLTSHIFLLVHFDFSVIKCIHHFESCEKRLLMWIIYMHCYWSGLWTFCYGFKPKFKAGPKNADRWNSFQWKIVCLQNIYTSLQSRKKSAVPRMLWLTMSKRKQWHWWDHVQFWNQL